MSRLSFFNSPLLLGFEHFEQTLDRISKAGSDGYPPYDVEQIGENRLRIILAVAGFTLDDLQVQVEDNQLLIRGKRREDKERVFLHRGIAARQFHRSFVLAEGIEVTSAELVNGLLAIDLERPISEPVVKKVEIRQAESHESAQVLDNEALEIERED